MRELFVPKKFSDGSRQIIAQAAQIIDAYQRQGYKLSLRQLYYQFVSRNWLVNSEKSYKNLGAVVADARLAGLLDWEAIEDRGREVVWPAHWDNPAQIVEACANQFRIDKWASQEVFPFVMVEKQALEGVLVPVCRELDVRFAANKGYGSASFFYDIGKTIAWQADCAGQRPVVFYLGDHDPSGLDMSRDVQERLTMFARCEVEVRRLALNIDQVERLGLPENPAKMSDSRAEEYVARFGYSSWELDALEPRYLADLVRSAVEEVRDDEAWAEACEREEEMKTTLQGFAREQKKRWEGA